MDVSRRGAIVGGFGIAGAALIGSLSDAQSAQAAGIGRASDGHRPSLRVLSTIDVSAATRGFGSLETHIVPAELSVSWPQSWSRRATIAVGFDSRRFQLVDHVKATVAGQVLTATRSGSQFVVELPQSAGQLELTFALPLRALNNYPTEDVAPVGPVSVTVSDASNSARSVTVKSTSSSSSLVRSWGLELYGVWAKQATAHANQSYRRPAGLRVLSVGPSPSPANALVRIVADSQMVESFNLLHVSRNNQPIGTPNARRPESTGAAVLEIPIGIELAAGEVLDLAFDTREHRGELRGLHVGAMTLLAENQTGWLQRFTSRETTTSTTSSGAPAIVHQYLGKI